MTSIPTTPTIHNGTSPHSPLSDISMSSPSPKTPPQQITLHQLRDLHLSPPYQPQSPQPQPRRFTATKAVLSHPHLLHRILSNIYDAPSDYQKGSYLIPYDENPETTSLVNLYDLQWVSKYWQEIIFSLNILPFTNPSVPIPITNKGDTHRLHIPFLTWLGSKMKELAEDPTVPKTYFPEILPLVKRSTIQTDGFTSKDFISNPPVSKIWLGFQVDSHPPFTQQTFKNPDSKKRKAVGCPIGPFLTSVEYSYKIRDHRRKNDRIMEDAFIISNEDGVTVHDVVTHIIGILSGYYIAKRGYMLWMIEIGFPAGRKEVLRRETDLGKRLEQTLFESCDRSARIFLVDSRLEIKNEHRIAYKLDEDYDPFFNQAAKKRKPGGQSEKSETLKLSMRGNKTEKRIEETEAEEEEEEEAEELKEPPRKRVKLERRKGKQPIKMEDDYMVDSHNDSDEDMEED
ncbi:hypothetical protein TWF506_004659 [Arthrobotrys conoides]|uniref:Uncharacterized protein n=1 Tax=Arthrobotrys conoides TaxID=74498 RepID=A0AAN8N2G5_9PEZI